MAAHTVDWLPFWRMAKDPQFLHNESGRTDGITLAHAMDGLLRVVDSNEGYRVDSLPGHPSAAGQFAHRWARVEDTELRVAGNHRLGPSLKPLPRGRPVLESGWLREGMVRVGGAATRQRSTRRGLRLICRRYGLRLAHALPRPCRGPPLEIEGGA